MSKVYNKIISNPESLTVSAGIGAGLFILTAALYLGAELTLVLVGAVLAFTLFLYILLKKELYGLFIIMILFYLIPFSSIDPDVRRLGANISLFSRFSMLISPWDWLMLILVSVWFYKNVYKDKVRIKWIEHPEIRLYFGIMIVSLIIGFLHVSGSFLSYGPTRIVMPIVTFLPFCYFLVMYILTLSFIRSKRDVDRSLNFIWIMNIVLIFYSVYRIIGILSGSINTMWGFGLPIILYEQVFLILFPIFAYTAMRVQKVKHFHNSFILMLIFFILLIVSTRRTYYIYLFGGFTTVLIFLIGSRIISGFRFVKIFSKIILSGTIVGMIIYFTFPVFIEGMGNSLKSIYFLSEYGLARGGNTRKAEITNIFENMNNNYYSYLVGYGLGTMWHEESRVPLDTMAYTKKDLENSKSWFPKFHLPYVNKIYRFGFIGILLFLYIIGKFFMRSIRRIKAAECNKFYQAYLVAISTYLMILLFESGDSPNPTALIFCGFLYGIQSGISRYCLGEQNEKKEIKQ